ncbi:MAG: hypothetical protein ACRC5Q_03800 [Culicoidibacterales bacterium]
MIITLVDQRLFLAEQYDIANAPSEASAIILTLLEIPQAYTEQQTQRLIELLIKLEMDDAFIQYFESGQAVDQHYFIPLVRAYARTGLFEQVQALLEQIDEQTQASFGSELVEIRQKFVEQERQMCRHLLQMPNPAFEQLVSQFQNWPELMHQPDIFKMIEQLLEDKKIEPPYLALVLDVFAQQGIVFASYAHLQPIEATPWIQLVRKAVSQQSENQELLQQLMMWKILQMYPKSLSESGFESVETFIVAMTEQVQGMLTGKIDD